MTNNAPIFVAGATGGTGGHAVNRLLERGNPVRGLVRDADRGREAFGDRIELVVGDTRAPETFASAVAGCGALICTTGAQASKGGVPEEVEYQGVKNLVEAAKTAGVGQFVLVSSIGATKLDHRLNQIFDNILMWKLRGEDAVRESGIPYTVVRPGGLRDDPGGERAIALGQGDEISGTISREDVAEVCLRALDHDAARGVTFETIHAESGDPAADWAELFAPLRKDSL